MSSRCHYPPDFTISIVGEILMSGPIIRTGTTPKFWENFDKAFGKSDGSAKKKSTAAKKKVAKKKKKK